MVRLILIVSLGILFSINPIEAQDKISPRFKNILIEWGILAPEISVERDTLDPKEAERLAKKAVKAERKIEREKIRKNKNLYDQLNSPWEGDANGRKRLAMTLFDNQSYAASLEVFNELSSDEKKSADVMKRMATAYRLNGQPEAAEYWYGRLVRTSDESEYLLDYAQVLQQNKKCEDAVYWYKEYAKKTNAEPKTDEELMASCLKVDAMLEHSSVVIRNIEELNTEFLDFAPIPTGNGIVFTSSRASDRYQIQADCWTNENFTDLFYADGYGCDFNKIETLNGAINGKYHDGAASFGAGGNIMFFTRNNYKGRSKDGLIDLKIWQSVKRGDAWSEAEEMPFNSDEFATCHPALSPDGQRLYFASDRPGGFGGLDLYVTHFVDGDWQEPMNLGEEVNSTGNEVFPFIGADETLYYSSGGFQGMGGLDLYKVEKERRYDESTWTGRTNMGTPFNSSKDDFGFYVDPDGSNGFLTSNRVGGKGGDDIYCWEGDLSKPTPPPVASSFCISDYKTGEFIDNANVNIEHLATATASSGNLQVGEMVLTLKPLANGEYALNVTNPNVSPTGRGMGANKTFNTSKSGGFDFVVDKAALYTVEVSKPGYDSFKSTYSGEELLAIENDCFELKKESCFNVSGVVKLTESDRAITDARVTIFDRTTNTNIEVMVDSEGKYETCLPCDHEFRMNGRLDGHDSNYSNFNSKGEDCGAGGYSSNINLSKRKVIARGTYPVTTPLPMNQPAAQYQSSVPCNPCGGYFVPCNPCGQVAMNVPARKTKTVRREDAEMALPFEIENIRKGALIALEDLYYDYNSFEIKEDASRSLDKLLELMNQEPDMKIEMSAHTDARGNAYYNDKLSLQRAEAARSYLLARGINCDRITVKGYGERRLKVQCDENSNCSEEEHRKNRRTEFRVSAFN